MKSPPAGCHSLWANSTSDVYAWREPWLNPRTGEPWPAAPALAPITARDLPDVYLAQLIAVLPFADVVDALRWERDRRLRVAAAP